MLVNRVQYGAATAHDVVRVRHGQVLAVVRDERVRGRPDHCGLIRRVHALGQKQHRDHARRTARHIELDVFTDPVGGSRIARGHLRVQRRVIVLVEREKSAKCGVINGSCRIEIAGQSSNRSARACEVLPLGDSLHEADTVDHRPIEFRLRVDLLKQIWRIRPAAAEDVAASRFARVHRPLAYVARHVVHAARAHAARCAAFDRASGFVATLRHHPASRFGHRRRVPLDDCRKCLAGEPRECTRLVPTHAANGKVLHPGRRRSALPRGRSHPAGLVGEECNGLGERN